MALNVAIFDKYHAYDLSLPEVKLVLWECGESRVAILWKAIWNPQWRCEIFSPLRTSSVQIAATKQEIMKQLFITATELGWYVVEGDEPCPLE